MYLHSFLFDIFFKVGQNWEGWLRTKSYSDGGNLCSHAGIQGCRQLWDRELNVSVTTCFASYGQNNLLILQLSSFNQHHAMRAEVQLYELSWNKGGGLDYCSDIASHYWWSWYHHWSKCSAAALLPRVTDVQVTGSNPVISYSFGASLDSSKDFAEDLRIPKFSNELCNPQTSPLKKKKKFPALPTFPDQPAPQRIMWRLVLQLNSESQIVQEIEIC